MAPHLLRTRATGVSLVEALVALAVMAFGMLALVGVQTTMRLNSDVAKQRTEATRIANEEIERLRVFTQMTADPAAPGLSWDEIASRNLAAYQPPDAIGNTTYSIVRTVNRLPIGAAANVTPPSQQKVVRVQVQWTDRAGGAQTVTLDSLVAGAAPALSALLSAPPVRSAAHQTGGHDVTIPREAVDLRDGTSAFKPFNTGTVVWVFNNLTGRIVSRCTGVVVAQSAIVRADLNACAVVDGRRLAGVVQFDLGNAPSSENPAGPILPLAPLAPVVFGDPAFPAIGFQPNSSPICVANSPARRVDGTVATPQGFAVAYECVVFPDANGWGGKLDVTVANQYANGDALPGNRNSGDYKVCRYTTANTDYTRNADHPKSYCLEAAGVVPIGQCNGNKVTSNLINQNFLVIDEHADCPADNAATPSINGNTRPHQS